MADVQEWEEEVEEDDDDEEEEDDFIPGADDEDDGDYDDLEEDDDEENDEDPNALPTFLEGELFMDLAKGLCYEQPGVFGLVCQEKSFANHGSFSFQSPPLDSPLVFAGWIQDPSEWLDFTVTFSKQTASSDPLEEKLLNAQEERNIVNNASPNKASQKKTGDDDDEVKQKSSSSRGTLKSPPSYSQQTDDEARKSPPKSHLKAPPSYSLEGNNAVASVMDDRDSVFVLSGSQMTNEDRTKNIRKITFRGTYRPPASTVERLFVISSVQVEHIAVGTTAGGSAGDSKVVPAAAASTAVVAVARKRRRTDNDDDSVEGTGGVEYQELIDLHDDAGLSTEELRRRYYGGDADDYNGNGDAKEPATNSSNKRTNPSSENHPSKNDHGDDDNDDDYGF